MDRPAGLLLFGTLLRAQALAIEPGLYLVKSPALRPIVIQKPAQQFQDRTGKTIFSRQGGITAKLDLLPDNFIVRHPRQRVAVP